MEISTEEKILAAAENIFLRDGYGGSRMQDIADLAGINKAMLHYYFRSKDKLFEKIFDKNVKMVFPQIAGLITDSMSFQEVVFVFIEKYIHTIRLSPFLPLFLINTMNNPQRPDFLDKLPIELNRKLIEKYITDKKSGNINTVDPLQFLVSLMGMCIFPFLAKPIIKKVADFDETQFEIFIENRIEELKKYVAAILKP